MPMPGNSASGAKILFGIGLEDRVTGKQTGAPRPIATPVTAPTVAPTSAAGSTGLVTGEVAHKYSRVTLSRGETECSAASTPLTVSAKIVGISDLLWGTDPETIGLRMYRNTTGAAVPITNGTFTSDMAGWTGAHWAQAAAACLHTAGVGYVQPLSQNISVISGTTYRVKFTTAARSAGSVTPAIGAAAGVAVISNAAQIQYITALTTGAVALTFTPTADFDGSVDTITVDLTTGWRHIWTLWDGVTVTYDDNTAVGSEDATHTPKTANETAANFGLQFMEVDPTPILQRIPNKITTGASTGTLGKPKSITLGAAYAFDLSSSLRTGPLVPALASFAGKPTVMRIAGEPVFRLSFPLADEPEDAASFWGIIDRGGSPAPRMFRATKVNGIEIALPENAEAGLKLKGMALSDMTSSPGYADAGNTGTYTLCPVLYGTRSDDSADAIIVEVTAALSAGVMKIKARIGAGTQGAELSVYCEAVTNKQIAGPADDEDATELFGPAGALGFDAAENKEPLSVRFPGDLSLILLGDKFSFARDILKPIPRTGAAYSNERRLSAAFGLPRFTRANVTIRKGSSSADVVVLGQAANVKLDRAMTVKNWLGASAKRGKDLTPTGYITAEIEFEQELDSWDFDEASRSEERYVVEINIQGPKIWINPGTYSDYREQVLLTLAQADVLSTVQTSGQGAMKNKITFASEQPADGSQAFIPEITTAQGWNFDAVA